MSDAIKVRVFLDVDGVVNACPPIRYGSGEPFIKQPKCWPHWRRTDRFGLVAVAVADKVREWATTPGVDVRWLTTWCEKANEDLAPIMGIPPLPVEGEEFYRYKEQVGRWWKFHAVAELWEDDPVPFVWLDDDLGGDEDDCGAFEWAIALEPNALAIRPNDAIGLTPADLALVDEFIQGHL